MSEAILSDGLAGAGLTVIGAFEFQARHSWSPESLAGFAQPISILSRSPVCQQSTSRPSGGTCTAACSPCDPRPGCEEELLEVVGQPAALSPSWWTRTGTSLSRGMTVIRLRHRRAPCRSRAVRPCIWCRDILAWVGS